MEQNRFSRQLIVLRAVIPGYSGHARLLQAEDATTLDIRLQTGADSGELWAAIVHKGDDGCHAQALGPLQRDDRGQATGAFDAARITVEPEIIAIVLTDGDDCKLAMSGFLNGSRTVNWSDVRTAACDAVRAPAPPAAADLLPEAPDADNNRTTAAEAAGISPDAVWPEEVAALQEDFAAAPPVHILPDLQYTFILMPATDETPEYYAGIRCRHGIPTHACYAVRGNDRHTPPTGLEDFVWRDGYWITCIDAETGAPADD
jgi:hypothetical protein